MSGVGTGKARRAPESETKSWKRVEGMRCRNLFRVPGGRPRDGSLYVVGRTEELPWRFGDKDKDQIWAGGLTQAKIEDLLDAFDENHGSPTDTVRSLPSQAHFDQQLEVTNDLEGSCKPFVP